VEVSMVKTTSVLTGLFALAALSVGCDDGPGTKDINCISLCPPFVDCVGDENYSKAECKDECKDEDGDKVDSCQDCLESQDSCTEKLTCTDECAGVITLGGF